MTRDILSHITHSPGLMLLAVGNVLIWIAFVLLMIQLKGQRRAYHDQRRQHLEELREIKAQEAQAAAGHDRITEEFWEDVIGSGPWWRTGRAPGEE